MHITGESLGSAVYVLYPLDGEVEASLLRFSSEINFEFVVQQCGSSLWSVVLVGCTVHVSDISCV